MKNQISTQLSKDDHQVVKDALATIKSKLTFLKALQEEEKRNMMKVGPRSVDFVQDALLSAQEHPEILPANFSVQEFAKDATVLPAMLEIQLIINELNKLVNDTVTLLGSDSMYAALEVYSYLGIAAQHNPNLKPTLEKLKTRFSAQGRKKAKETTNGTN